MLGPELRFYNSIDIVEQDLIRLTQVRIDARAKHCKNNYYRNILLIATKLALGTVEVLVIMTAGQCSRRRGLPTLTAGLSTSD